MKAIKNGQLACDQLLKDITRSRDNNYYNMPITAFGFNDEDCEMYNELVSCLKASSFKRITRTPSGAISSDNKLYPAYDIRHAGGSIEITLINYNGNCRLQWRNSPKELFTGGKLKMSGHQAFQHFKSLCLKFGIDIKHYAHLDEQLAQREKEQIEPAIINIISDKFVNRTFDNVHHIDFHSSYMSGLVNTHPEFREVVEYIYNKRKDDDIKYKSILNMTQGYMQSKLCKYKYAWLSRDMIKDNNDRIRDKVKKLLKAKRLPLLVNTDGIWYQGELYHDETEGNGICTWGHDHINCRIRIKSSGAYEYEEAGKYYPVVRGLTNLDKIKPREEWNWGDIYNNDCTTIIYQYENEYIKFPDGTFKGVKDYD